MKQVLVTGSDGQLGLSLQEISEEFKGISLSFTTKDDLDITKADEVRHWFGKGPYDYCINCAAFTNVDQAEKTPEAAFELNAEALKLLAQEARSKGTVLIHISTDYVFDGDQKEGYKPDDQPNPINQYGMSKLKGEEYIRSILERYVIIRTSWLYSEYGHNFYKTILGKARAGESLTVTDAEVGCPTNANHLARYILEKIASGENWQGTYHYTDGVSMSWYEFAKEILKENGLQNELKILPEIKNKRPARRPKYSILLT
ncbi:MAG: dTDP-4-dehydrorhamnose reductase [Bacteroidota bacterium]